MRDAIVAEAIRWLGTPYKTSACLRGVGANCATLLYGVALASGAIPDDAPPPRWYTPQLHVHSREERLIEYVKAYGAREIAEEQVGPGDIVLYRSGQSHGHAGIVVAWPERIVHTVPAHGCCYAHGTREGYMAQKSRRFFTLV
jgi:cell wall-associated NlpC family hydrolase